MKRLLFLVVLALSSIAVYAQQPVTEIETEKQILKNIVKSYNKWSPYVIVFDYSDGDYLGNTFKEFAERLKKLPQTTNTKDKEAMMLMKVDTIYNGEELPTLFKQYENEFYRLRFKRDTPENRKRYSFYIKIKIESVSPLAGIKASWQLFYEDDKYKAYTIQYSINVEDGRWNTFCVLFAENAHKQAKLFFADYIYNFHLRTNKMTLEYK